MATEVPVQRLVTVRRTASPPALLEIARRTRPVGRTHSGCLVRARRMRALCFKLCLFPKRFISAQWRVLSEGHRTTSPARVAGLVPMPSQSVLNGAVRRFGPLSSRGAPRLPRQRRPLLLKPGSTRLEAHARQFASRFGLSDCGCTLGLARGRCRITSRRHRLSPSDDLFSQKPARR